MYAFEYDCGKWGPRAPGCEPLSQADAPLPGTVAWFLRWCGRQDLHNRKPAMGCEIFESHLYRGFFQVLLLSACAVLLSFLDLRFLFSSTRWCSSACRARASPCSSACCHALEPPGRWPLRTSHKEALGGLARLQGGCRTFETIHQPSAAEQVVSSLAMGKEHPPSIPRSRISCSRRAAREASMSFSTVGAKSGMSVELLASAVLKHRSRSSRLCFCVLARCILLLSSR